MVIIDELAKNLGSLDHKGEWMAIYRKKYTKHIDTNLLEVRDLHAMGLNLHLMISHLFQLESPLFQWITESLSG